MSSQDYYEAEKELFFGSDPDENREYYEEELNDISFKKIREENAKETSKESSPEDLEDDEEIAEEILSKNLKKIKVIKQLPIQNLSLKENAETPDMYETRKSIADMLQKNGSLSLEDIEMYSRMINNRFWYNMKYPEHIEKIIDSLLE